MKIYALVSEDEVLYIGKTTCSLKVRKKHHKSKKHNRCHSKNIPSDIVWDIILLEDVEDYNSIEYERFYIDYLEPRYNKLMPGRSGEEYEKSKERKEYKHAYHRTKEYREKDQLRRGLKYYSKNNLKLE